MFSKYSKALVIGAGSGRDMASAILITEKLRQRDIEADLAGFLTPWALHEFDGRLEDTINQLSAAPTRKFLVTKEDVALDTYFEPELLQMNDELSLGIRELYLFSLQYGTERLKSEIEKLVCKKAYDLIVAVDVGGDILARRKDLPSVFTPIVDLSCLEILAEMDTTAEKYLAVVAPGVDGELSYLQLAEIFAEFEREDVLFVKERIYSHTREYQTFMRVYDEINKRTKSFSHTGDVIRRAVEGESDFKKQYCRKLRICDRMWNVMFSVQLDRSLATNIFYFNLDSVKALRKEIRIKYRNMIQAYRLLKALGAGGTEVDLTYIPGAINDGEYSDPYFILNPFNRASDEQKMEILEYGLDKLGGKVII